MDELFLHDEHSAEYINDIRRKVYGESFVKPCDPNKFESNMDSIIDIFEKAVRN